MGVCDVEYSRDVVYCDCSVVSLGGARRLTCPDVQFIAAHYSTLQGGVMAHAP